MAKVKFKREFLMDELDLPYSALENNITSTGRWTVHHKIIFEYGGKFYSAYYSEGATEQQDESPWEYQSEIS